MAPAIAAAALPTRACSLLANGLAARAAATKSGTNSDDEGNDEPRKAAPRKAAPRKAATRKQVTRTEGDEKKGEETGGDAAASDALKPDEKYCYLHLRADGSCEQQHLFVYCHGSCVAGAPDLRSTVSLCIHWSLSLSLGVLRDAFDGFDQPPHYACTCPGHTHTPTHLVSEPLNAQVSTGSHRLNGADAGLLRRL